MVITIYCEFHCPIEIKWMYTCTCTCTCTCATDYYTVLQLVHVHVVMYLSIINTIGAGQSVLIKEVSSFKRYFVTTKSVLIIKDVTYSTCILES